MVIGGGKGGEEGKIRGGKRAGGGGEAPHASG